MKVETCPTCKGLGKVKEDTCVDCNGSGIYLQWDFNSRRESSSRFQSRFSSTFIKGEEDKQSPSM